ncbi:hypothetical protein, partial [Pseudomonas aeruginosa]|uniref:hypothetical protein n=1 Tax=Pseudomonas aeruginosa TaxID=287 RepID=UPI00374786C0
NNPGFILAQGANSLPGMPNENSMAFNDLANLPITQNGSGNTWTVVHSANYNWYVVRVLDESTGQIMSSSVTNPTTYQVTSDPGQGGLYAAPIQGTGQATGSDHT